jgi:hypothetical protein
MNTSVCGESKISDVAKRLKAENPSVRTFVDFPSSEDESKTKTQHYCGEDTFHLFAAPRMASQAARW